jgi:hypothetical protein
MQDYVYNEPLDWRQMFFHDKLTEFDSLKAKISACLARDSYYNDQRCSETLLRLGFYDAQLFSHQHLEAICGCRDIETPDGTLALIAIVFRGSDDVEDWLRNLDFRKIHFLDEKRFPELRRLKVHKGIAENVHNFEGKAARVTFKNGAVKGNLAQILADENKRKQCLFWIIGHSLGGAMATLFAARLYDYYGVAPDRIIVHTFGAPPIGNRYFASRYGHQATSKRSRKKLLLNIIRFVNTEDPIPGQHFSTAAWIKTGLIPHPPYLLLGFRHVGQALCFSPHLLDGFYKKYKEFTGRQYSSSNFKEVHFMEAYLAGMDVLSSV